MGSHAQSTQLPHSRSSSPAHTGPDRDQAVSCCMRHAVPIVPAHSQLRRKSIYVLSPLSEGHTVFL